MKYVPVSLTEEFVMNYSALPPELDGWRYYRIELGGHAESCFKELPIFLPKYANAYILDMLFDHWQTKGHKSRRKTLHKIIQELERAANMSEKLC